MNTVLLTTDTTHHTYFARAVDARHPWQGIFLETAPERVMAALKRHGVACCPTAEAGINHVGDDLFRLKRVMVV